MKQELVSIIIPVYNVKQWILDLAYCFKRQTYNYFEVIFVDDNSIDGSIELIESLKEERFICIRRPDNIPKGAQSCRNYGMNLAKGEYLIFFDSDDLISDSCLKQRVEYISANPNVDFCIFPAYSFSDDINKPLSFWGIERDIDPLSSFLKAKMKYTVWTNIYRTSSIKKINWDYNVKVFQDTDFNIMTLLHNMKFLYAINAEPDYFWRVGHNPMSVCSNKVSKEKLLSTIYLCNKISTELKSLPDYKIRQKEFLDFHIMYMNRLFDSKDNSNICMFINYMRDYYTQWTINRLYFIHYCTKVITNNKIRKGLQYFGLGCLFLKSEYIKLIKPRISL